ncbi:MAG: hypothetical protein KGI52_08560 [Burkholderiales bacterium]|nr:hypothetical protein [Burkholderiales bacterium]
MSAHTTGPLVCWSRDGSLRIVEPRTTEQQMLDVLVEVERCSDALLFHPTLIADIRAAIVRAAGPNWRAAL